MKTAYSISFGILLASLGAVPGRAEFQPAAFLQSREVAGAVPSDGLFRIEADAEIHRHAGADLASLVLAKEHEGRWRAMPFVLRRVHAPARSGRFELAHRVESLEETPDGAIEIVVSLATDSAGPTLLEIDTPLRDFEKGVTVAAAGSDGSWNEIVKDGVVFDHSRYLDFRRTTLTLPPTKSGRFRIRIAEATEAQRSRLREITRTIGDASGLTVTETAQVESRPFRIDRLRFLLLPEKSAPADIGRQQFELEILEQDTNAEGSTRLLLDSGHFPLERIDFETRDRNFRRPITVQVSTDDGGWRTVQRGHLHRYEVGEFREESLSLELAEIRAERLRVLVEHAANPPVTISGASGEGPVYELFFLAEAGDRPVVFLGGNPADLDRKPLDTAAIETALAHGVAAPSLVLGDLVPNPDHRPSKPSATMRPLDSQPVLWTAIALAVAILIAVLYRALRKIEAVDSETPPPS